MTESTQPPTLAGDHADDDGQVIADLLDPADAIDADDLPTRVGPRPSVPVVPRLTRIMTQTLAVQATWGPALLLPADPNRVRLSLWAASDTATDYARFSDDAGKIGAVSSSALIFSGQIVPVDGHTGPVWVSAPDAVGPVHVTAVAVTR